ncbi:GHKL domain-containing protein [Bacteroides sp. OttesenSCG-928-D19]|nr:GHKL domain-containing protein [Bacteroides sp. OttesenSCG-928-D19]
MKQYSVLIIVHILSIVVLSIGIYLLAKDQLWFSTLVVLLLLVAIGVNLYRMQTKHIELMKRLTESIRFNDLTQTYSMPMKSKVMKEMSSELTESLQQLKARLLEEEIRHQYYENLLDKVDTAVLVAEENGQIEWMNRAASLLLKHRSQIPDILVKAIAPETQTIRLEREGQVQEMAVSATTFLARGKERQLISLKNIHSVLEKNEMEAWQKLIRVLTHEIMNSITPIISLSETITERNTTESVTEKEYSIMLQAMQTIHRRSKGLLGFVENYRRLTRIPQPNYAEVSVNELLSDLKQLYPGQEVEVVKMVPDTSIAIDRTLIEQVLINLIKNAKEACLHSDNQHIVVKAIRKRGNREVEISIRDNGEGILPDVLDKIFIPFYTTKTNGSGIGLSLCKQIINAHGGSISVHSEMNKGSCFHVFLPDNSNQIFPV